jgi:hypothetical protein
MCEEGWGLTAVVLSQWIATRYRTDEEGDADLNADHFNLCWSLWKEQSGELWRSGLKPRGQQEVSRVASGSKDLEINIDYLVINSGEVQTAAGQAPGGAQVGGSVGYSSECGV